MPINKPKRDLPKCDGTGKVPESGPTTGALHHGNLANEDKPTGPPEAVEAACKATWDSPPGMRDDGGERWWRKLPENVRSAVWSREKRAIEAAYPAIREHVLDEVKARISGLKRDRMELSDKRPYDRAIDAALAAIEEGKNHE